MYFINRNILTFSAFTAAAQIFLFGWLFTCTLLNYYKTSQPVLLHNLPTKRHITIYSPAVWCSMLCHARSLCEEESRILTYCAFPYASANKCLQTSFRLQSVQGGLTCHEWTDRRRCDLVRRVCAAEGSHRTPAPHEGVPGVTGHQRPWDPTRVQPADQWHHHHHGVPTGGQLHLHWQHRGGRIAARAGMPGKNQTLLKAIWENLTAAGKCVQF